MGVLALLAVVGALPEPAVQVLLDRLDEVLACDVRARGVLPVLVPRVAVDVNFRRLAVQR